MSVEQVKNTLEIDLTGRFDSAFGFVAKNTSALTGINQHTLFLPKTPEKQKMTDYPIERYNLSQPNFDSLQFKGSDNTKIQMTGLSNKDLAPPPMISLSRAKNINVTQIDGDAGEVVEVYGMKPWHISIRGLLVDMENKSYPTEKVKMLRQIFEKHQSWRVTSTILNDVGVRDLYFTSVEIGFVKGYEDTVKYKLEAKSIEAVEFSLNDKI